MEPKEKDIMYELFAEIPDEQLPFNFNEKVMLRIQRKALLREKRNKQLEIFGYISGAVAMIAVCIYTLHYMGVSIELPELKRTTWTFHKPDYNIFSSRPFILGLYIGISALFLLIIDSKIRRHIEKTRHK